MDYRSTQWPTFLGIGVPKAGTTWLYDLLAEHPQVWVPPNQPEVHFLNREFERGNSWYAQFFPDKESEYREVGEITPHYLYCESDRIEWVRSALPSIEKLILLLRDPVDRLYSHYWHRRRVENLDVSFQSFIDNRPIVVEWGRYSKYVERWLQHFDRNELLVLTTERDLVKTRETRKRLASFLEVDHNLFPEGAGAGKKNQRHLPRFPNAYAMAIWIRRMLRRADIRWPGRVARRLGITDWFGRRKVQKQMDPAVRRELSFTYQGDVKRLEQLLEMEFSEWTSTVSDDSESPKQA